MDVCFSLFLVVLVVVGSTVAAVVVVLVPRTWPEQSIASALSALIPLLMVLGVLARRSRLRLAGSCEF